MSDQRRSGFEEQVDVNACCIGEVGAALLECESALVRPIGAALTDPRSSVTGQL